MNPFRLRGAGRPQAEHASTPQRTRRPPRAGRRLRALTAGLATLLLAGTTLFASAITAQAANPDSHVVASWNMQAGPDRWAGAYNLAGTHDLVALQEVPLGAPAGSQLQGQVNGVEHYLWVQGDNGPLRHLYILRTPSRSLGMITAWQPDNVLNIAGVYRPALGVVNRADGILFASVHAASNGGRPNDAGALLRRISDAADAEGFLEWAALGDFNFNPANLPGLGLPPDSRIYNSGQATQQNGNELDYMVSDVDTDRWQATVLPNYGSDHWPIRFGSLQAAAEPVDLTIHADNSDRLLDVYQGQTGNGTHVIQYHANGAANQQWYLAALGYNSPSGTPLYRIVSKASNKCLDVANGQGSRAGDYLNIWDCHPREGEPGSGGYPRDTQNFTLEHPNAARPNLTLLRNNATGLYANINHNQTGDGTWVVQWPDQFGPFPAPNETFYLHPVVA
ncbi:RICIN domain-containing protein [Streptomyces sp. NPDC048442]|uniref:RICIN domain-containing protein n=1 Tax=Streptomyces sp. NPDC048442 TaxID=3154823 RepID=UPI00344AE4B8